MLKTWGPFVLILLIISCFPLQSFDLFWHLKTGEYILDHGIPMEDPFSANSRGEWINHAWGFDVAAHLVDRVAGVNGLILLRLLFAGLLGGLIYRHLLLQGQGTAVGLAVTGMVLSLARHRLDLRPDELAHLLFALLLILFALRKGRWIPLLMLAWVNLHASFLMGIGTALFFYFWEWVRIRKWEPVLLGAAALAAPLVNPFGWKAYMAPLALQVQVKTMGLVNPEWQAPSMRQFLPYFLAIALFALVLFLERKSLRAEHLLLVPLTILAFSSLRFMGFLAVAMGFFMPPLKRWTAWPAAALGAAALGFSLMYVAPLGWGLDEKMLPVRETRFAQEAKLAGPMFNSPGFGGWLIYRLFPGRKVFWDGRNELYADLLREVKAALPDSARWADLLDTYKIRWVLVKYQGEETVISGSKASIRPWSVNHFPPRLWSLAYWDDAGMVFVRRDTGAPHELRMNPESLRFIAGEMESGRLDRGEARRELEAKLAENPGCGRARWLLTSLFP